MKVVAAVVCLVVATTARSPYLLPDGYIEVLGGEPNKVFDCANRAYGYYADVASGCRIFHVCDPVYDEEGLTVVRVDQFSFLCGNLTIFSQEYLTCTLPEEAFPCDQAATIYESSNAEFGKIPEEP
ncbi:U-scoloptoxin(01)-Er1a [Procambarus clarkii]|uniref:U-scoloptoxin(01)-Er1a n=1 Tax=Procambarus clarkii TaxID=6728 RepID=UPI00374418F1